MAGLELSREYYEFCGKDMIKNGFAEYESKIAVGLAGGGSDCFGFDDDISADHDSGAGFCLWLTDGDYDKIGFSLARAYAALPDMPGKPAKAKVLPYGKNHFGVMRISDFYRTYTGSGGAPESAAQWLSLPEHSLACAVSGEVFRDDLGEFTAIREKIKTGMPRDVYLKKLSLRVIEMAQSGQYNFARCLKHGEKGAAALALAKFAESCVSFAYLVNSSYAPFYKWALKGMKSFEIFPDLAFELEELLTGETGEYQIAKLEKICSDIASYLRKEALSECADDFLEPHAYEIQAKIKDPSIISMHIFE